VLHHLNGLAVSVVTFLRFRRSAGGSIRSWSTRPILSDPLVGHRDGCQASRFSFEQVQCPRADPFRVGLRLPQSGSHACYQQAPDVAVAHLRDASQSLLASTGSIKRCQAQPGRKLTAILELPGIADGGDNGRGRHRADTWYRPKQHHAAILFGLKPHPHLIPSDPQVQSDELIAEIGQDVNGNLRDN
jgi:hypothetical protein